MPPNSSLTFTPHTLTSLVQLLVYKPCSVFSFSLLRLTLFKKENFYYYNYSSSDSTAFCIASISSAPNSPISATQSCSSDSSDSSNSTTRYSQSMPSCKSSVSLQIISTRHFSQRLLRYHFFLLFYHPLYDLLYPTN